MRVVRWRRRRRVVLPTVSKQMLDAGQVLLLDVGRSQRRLRSQRDTLITCRLELEARGLFTTHRSVLPHRVVQVQVTSDDVELDSEQDDQQTGAVHGHDRAGETCTELWRQPASGATLLPRLYLLMIFRSSQISSLFAGLQDKVRRVKARPAAGRGDTCGV